MFVRGSSVFGHLVRIFALVISSIAGFGAGSAIDGQAQEPTALEAQKTVYRDAIGGQIDTYQITLNAGQIAKLTIEQRGIDVFIRLVGDDGSIPIEVDADPRSEGEEKFDLVAPTTGT